MADYGPAILSDREVMKKTVLRGTAEVYGVDVCDTTAVRYADEGDNKKKRRRSLRLAHWEAVMRAGLEQYRVGEFCPIGSLKDRPTQSFIKLALPPANDEQSTRLFHNRLMMLCQVSYHALAEKILTAGQRKSRKIAGASVPAAAPAEAGDGAGANLIRQTRSMSTLQQLL